MTADVAADWPVAAGPDWPARVGAFTTTRGDAPGFGFNLGDHVGDDPDQVARRRRLLAGRAGLAGIQWLRQVHGVRCIEATATSVTGDVPEADAAWTRARGVGVAVLTADCVPLVVAAADGSAVGVAHGGWRGLVGGVVGALLSAMPVAAGDAVAWIGPAIGPDAYEVGDDVAAAVRALPGVAGPVGEEVLRIGRRPDRYQLDLFALTRALLAQAGVTRIITDRLCTHDDPRFYSYRGEGETGRMATLAWLD